MGEAKRRRLARASGDVGVVYHHSSTLRTNLMWMSGVIDVEGQIGRVFHPSIGEIKTDASLRRGLSDFPAVAWFTSEIAIPNCLRNVRVMFTDKDTGEPVLDEEATRKMADALALNRVAIGFRLSENTDIVPWPSHPGFHTSEGKALNQTAQQVGDDPAKWFVSEKPIDLLKAMEFWSSSTVANPRLKRHDNYIKDMHNMVRMCRARKGIYIPPTWLKTEDARAFGESLGVPTYDGNQTIV
jgi:hypothetical protein